MNIKRIVAVIFACAGLWCLNAAAQQEAVPGFTLGSVVGYATNGAGFAFSPNVNIGITALGFAGSDIANDPYEVMLFDAGGNELAAAEITTGSTFYNQTYYDAISTIELIAGQTYYLGAAGLGGDENFWLGNAVGGGFNGSYSVNPDITYLNGVVGIMPPGTVPGLSQGSIYLVGANFMFTTTPEPAPACLLGLGGMLACVWRTTAARRRR